MKLFWVGGGLRNAQMVRATDEDDARRWFLDPANRLNSQLELVADVIAEAPPQWQDGWS